MRINPDVQRGMNFTFGRLIARELWGLFWILASWGMIAFVIVTGYIWHVYFAAPRKECYSTGYKYVCTLEGKPVPFRE